MKLNNDKLNNRVQFPFHKKQKNDVYDSENNNSMCKHDSALRSMFEREKTAELLSTRIYILFVYMRARVMH
jgi:hypothetical protein